MAALPPASIEPQLAEAPTVELGLESLPQTLTIVRAMLAGISEPLALDAELLDDLKTAVSEACNNVVMHAYGDVPGPMDVRLYAAAGSIRVVVEDRGIGMPPDPDVPGAIGLSVIRALARETLIEAGPGGGARITMTFAAQRDGQPLMVAPSAAVPGDLWEPEGGEEVLVSLSPVSLLAPVLGRMARTLAAIAHFSLDRFSDVYLITDSLAVHAEQSALNDRICARLTTGERRVLLTLGPFIRGTGARLTEGAQPGVRSALALLADELSVSADGEGEQLRVVVADRRV